MLNRLFFFFSDDFNGKIRTPEFTELAGNAVIRPYGNHLVHIIQFKYLFGTEFNADAASFAPFPVDDVFFEFGFCHVDSLEISTLTAII